MDVSKFVPGETSASVTDAVIQEIDPNDGHLVWSWNSKDHIGFNETDPHWWPTLTEPYDIIHMNSVEDDGDGVVFSARHLDAVYRIDKSTGNIDWKLGSDDPGDAHQQELDGCRRSFRGPSVRRPARCPAASGRHGHHPRQRDQRQPSPSRGPLQHRPGGQDGEARRIGERPPDPGSFCCGGARKLPTGDWVMSWG